MKNAFACLKPSVPFLEPTAESLPKTLKASRPSHVGLCAVPEHESHVAPFYKDLWSPAATNFSIAPSSWDSIRNFLDDSLRFIQAPPHTAIPVGAKLLSARHVPLLCLADLSCENAELLHSFLAPRLSQTPKCSARSRRVLRL